MDLILNTEDSCRRQEPARISLLVSYNKKGSQMLLFNY